jgi:hypothetical protein
MDEKYISASKLKAHYSWLGKGATLSPKDVDDIIDAQPAADVEPVVRGEWRATDAYPHRVYCSLCHKTNVPNEESLFERNEYPKFCMWCGAKMEGEKEGV